MKVAARFILTVLVLLMVLMVVLVSTQAGLLWSLKIAGRVLPIEIEVQQASGRWIGPINLQQITITHKSARFSAESLALDWQPSRLLRNRLDIDYVNFGEIYLQTETGDDRSEPPSYPTVRLPLDISVQAFNVKRLLVDADDKKVFEISALEVSAYTRNDTLYVKKLQSDVADWQVSMQGEWGLQADIPSDLSMALSGSHAKFKQITSMIKLRGNAGNWQLTQQLQSPVDAVLNLDVKDLWDVPEWTARLQAKPFALEPLGLSALPLYAGGNTTIEGRGRALKINTDLQIGETLTLLEDFTLTADVKPLAGDGWSVSDLIIAKSGTPMQARLNGHWRAAADKDFELKGEWDQLRWPLLGKDTQFISARGKLQLSGVIDAYEAQLNADLQGSDVPETVVSLEIKGGRQSAEIKSVRGDLLQGYVQGSGRVDWSPSLSWDLQFKGEGLNPGVQWSQWPGLVNAEINTRGEQSDGLKWFADVKSMQGNMRGYQVAAVGTVSGDRGELAFKDVELRSAENVLGINGRLDKVWGLDWRLDAPDLAALAPGLSGRASGKGSLSGSAQSPQLQGRISIAGLGLENASVEAVEVSLDFHHQRSMSLLVDTRNIQVGEQVWADLVLNVSGSPQQHDWKISGHGPNKSVKALARGAWNGKTWQGRLLESEVQEPLLGRWVQAQAINLKASAGLLEMQPLCWQQKAGQICMAAGLAEQKIVIDGEVKEFPASLADAWLPPGSGIDGVINGSFAFKQVKNAATGKAQVILGPGVVRIPDEDIATQLNFTGASLHAELDTDGISLKSRFELNAEEYCALELRVPGFRKNMEGFGQWPIQGKTSGLLKRNEWVSLFVPAVQKIQAIVQWDLAIQGTPTKLRFIGPASVSGLQFNVPDVGIEVKQGNFTLDAQGKEARVQGSIQSGGGKLALEGWLGEGVDAGFQAKLNVAGDNFLAADLPEYQVRVSPQLDIHMIADLITLKGRLLVPDARLAPNDFSGVVQPSRDAIVLDSTQTAAKPKKWKLNSNIELVLGDKILFNGFGLKGRLEGALHLADKPDTPTLARGELRIVDGVYKAYGQDLQIKRGRLGFSGGPVDDPGIDVYAVRDAGEVEAGILVRGELRDPELSLVSSPAMPQDQILSYLLFGRPLTGLSGAQGQIMYQAAQSMGFAGGEALTQQIGQTFGIEEVRFEQGDTLEQTSLVLGKYLTPRLYINYSIGVFDAINKFKTRYQLSSKWALQTEAAQEAGGDLIYTLER